MTNKLSSNKKEQSKQIRQEVKILLGALLITSFVFGAYISKDEISSLSKPITADTKQTYSANPDKPIEAVKLFAKEDVVHTNDSALTSKMNVTIPKGSFYTIDASGVQIELNEDLGINVCNACQLFVPNCRPMMKEEPEILEDHCATREVKIGSYNFDRHYRYLNSNKIMGYTGCKPNSEVCFIITTKANRTLTTADEKLLLKVMDSVTSDFTRDVQ